MNFIDIILVVIVLLGLARGFQKGLIKSFIGLVGWLVALVAASKLAGSVGQLFGDWVPSAELKVVCGFVAVVLVVITILHIVGMIAEKILAELNLSILDRFAGGLFGAAKGVLIVLVLISSTSPILQKFSFWKESLFTKQLLPLAPIAMQFSKDIISKTVPDLVPEELKKANAEENNSDKIQEQQESKNKNNQILPDSIKVDIPLDQIKVIKDKAVNE